MVIVMMMTVVVMVGMPNGNYNLSICGRGERRHKE
jgi:hypothetical protein